MDELIQETHDAHIDELAATTISPDLKTQKIFKRKLLISLSSLILLVIIGLMGFKYYLNFHEKQKALATSKMAFESAQMALTPNSYKDAISKLKRVIPADPHYVQAQKQIAILNSVSDITTLMVSLNTDMTKFTSALQQFDNSFESLRHPINSAAEYNYPASSTVGMSYIQKADTLYNELSASVANVNESVTTISNDLGLISSNSYLASFGNTTQILSGFQSISKQVSTIKSAAWNQIDSMKRNSIDYAIFSQVNTSNNILGENLISAKQGISALTGFANGKVNDLLREAEKVNN